MDYTPAQAAFDAPRIVLVTPDLRDRDLHLQLISDEKCDKVHPVGSLEDLLTYRLGHDEFSKRCFALVKDAADGTRDILAAIYTSWTAPDDAEASWRLLPGKVDEILREPSRLMTAPPKVVTFYSISSFATGGGKNLISQLHREFTSSSNPPILTTLSPLRSFRAWLEETEHDLNASLETLFDKAAAFLGEKKDGVQRFHQGNGAYIGAIHANANLPDSADGRDGMGFMVSYRYPRTHEAALANISDYKTGASIPVASYLRPKVMGV